MSTLKCPKPSTPFTNHNFVNSCCSLPWLDPSASQGLSQGNLFLQQLYPNLALLRVSISTIPDLYELYVNHEAWPGEGTMLLRQISGRATSCITPRSIPNT